MKRLPVLVLVLLVVGGIAAPTSAKKVDEVKFNAVYSVPKDLGAIEDLGELNIGCAGGEYTLVDGKFKKTTTTVFYPSEEAWEAGETGATVTVSGVNRYKGLWDVSADLEARFDLESDDLRYEFTFGTDGSESAHFERSGQFIDPDSGAVVEWWDINWTAVDDFEVLGSYWEGTCPNG